MNNEAKINKYIDSCTEQRKLKHAQHQGQLHFNADNKATKDDAFNRLY